MLRTLAATISFLLFGMGAMATHMSGGEIYWECIGPNQYRIRLVVYRDCAGINVDPTYNLVLTSPCGNRNLTVTHNGATELSQLCDLQLPNSTCNGGSLPGIQQYTYTGTITLPPCDSWQISWTNIYRNNAIVNLTNPGTRHMYIESVLNSADAPCNDSPTFTNTAIPYVCLGYPVTYSYGAVDAEGDSLSYQLIGARMVNGTPVPYTVPYTPAQPIPGITLDPVTGLMNFTLNTAGNWVVVVQVTEYDANGNVIGSIMRDMQFVAYPCSNIPPDAATGLVTNLSGQATSTGPRSIQVCESGDFCFDMVISDPNATNVLSAFTNALSTLPGATFTYTGTNPITATLCWTAQPGSSGFFPVIVNVNDGACPIPAFQTYVYSIEVLPGLAATIAVVDEACLGDGNGTATVNVTAGTAPYTYTWSTGASTQSITAGAGTHSVTVVDANGCRQDDLPAVIGAGAQPNQANAGNDFQVCHGDWPIALSGSVTNATGGVWSSGTGTVSGAWPTNTYTPSAAEIAAGSVTLVLTTSGNTGCPPASDTVRIDLLNSFQGMAVSGIDAHCHGASDGAAMVLPGGPEFSYLWNDPAAQVSSTATGLGAGTYTVLVSDGNGCDTTMSVLIASPQALSITSITPTPESCAGDGDGTLTAMATGGTAPYTYAWDTGSVGPVITATAGTYTVSVTDMNGCAPATGQGTITASGQPNAAMAGNDLVSCPGSGAIALIGTVTNATSGSWSGGDGTFSGTFPAVQYTPGPGDIAAGTVLLSLSTVGNTVCPQASDDLVINLPRSFLGLTTATTNASCNGTSTGTAAVLTQATDLTYQWLPGGQVTQSISAVAAGDHTVRVTDQFLCDTVMTVTVAEPMAITIADLPSVNESCGGVSDGTLTAVASGGTAPYTYTWSNGAQTPAITAGAGSYTVTVSDVNGCAPASATGTIAATGQPNQANAGPDLIGCMNAYPIALIGSVVNASGGQWSGGSGTILGNGLSIQYMPSSAEVLAGGVDLTLTTVGNTTCPPASDVVHIALSNSFLSAALTATNALCYGEANGSIAFTPDLPGTTYQWNDALGQTTATATGLGAGTYAVTVTDALGCDTTLSTTIGEPQVLVVAQVNGTDVSCHGGANGSIVLDVQGGTPAYTIAWSNGAAGSILSGLVAGSYTATVTDGHGCTAQVTHAVQEPEPMVVAVDAPDTVCVNAVHTYQASATGGAGGYLFNWGGYGSNSSVQLAFAVSQTIQLTVVDQAGCAGPTTPVHVTVLDLATATFSTYGDTTTCTGGVATVGASLTGYPAAVAFSWSPFGYSGTGPYAVPIQADQDIVVTVTDACGDHRERIIALRLEHAPSFQLPPVIAEGCAPLTVQFPDLNLGNVTHTWTLGNGQTSHMTAPLVTYPQGTYTVGLTVTTPLGCTSSSTTPGLVRAYAPPTAAFTASTYSTNIDAANVDFTDQSTGTIVGYDWVFGDGGTSSVMNPSYTFSDIGTFEVELVVVDNHGCDASAIQNITITPVYDVVLPTAFTPNPNGPGGDQSNGNGGNWVTGDLSNDVFYPFVRFVKDFRMRVFNRWGELIFESTDLNIGWDGYYRGQISPQDVYVVQTWFRFVDGKTVEKLSDLTLFR